MQSAFGLLAASTGAFLIWAGWAGKDPIKEIQAALGANVDTGPPPNEATGRVYDAKTGEYVNGGSPTTVYDVDHPDHPTGPIYGASEEDILGDTFAFGQEGVTDLRTRPPFGQGFGQSTNRSSWFPDWYSGGNR